jgi:transcriptional regulator with XRE-family HTH domain
MSLRKRVSRNIIKHRTRIGMSQENLAKRAGVSRAYIGHIEKERHSTSIDTLEKIATALEIDAIELFQAV